ncbi:MULTISPECIES: hypothetical protein [Chryseobacterium]|nr:MULTISPECIES: hypothetical protein [Chryseobacterium]MCL8538655.1 hypothetical protein [Chryseobacterium gallinarum]
MDTATWLLLTSDGLATWSSTVTAAFATNWTSYGGAAGESITGGSELLS